ncbi:MAG TPA: hypothetical protein PLM65_09365, partial [Smithella sp.]|nr:hypothetical protein [Smithella sp.]
MNDRLKNFPISFFAVVMGLTGATIAWKRTESIWNLNTMVSSALLVISSVVFLIILLFYATKIIKYPDDIRKEFKNITKLSFFPTISISLILLSIAWLESNTTLSTILWYGGTILQFIFTITIISIWIRHQSLEINAISPAWFIPVVGNILVPVAGVV